jgi:predicted Fe-Mo cluster-binding NifX family protein
VRIAIASDDRENVALHTGRCKGFVVYEIAEKSAARLEYRANGFTAHAMGQCSGEHAHEAASGHHSHAPLVGALSDCQALVTRGLGPRLVADLAARGIEAYLCVTEDTDEAARQYAQGSLARAARTGCCCRR